jgi:hypothetical protein
MLGNYSAEGAFASVAEETGDARTMALTLMSRALGHLDSDSNIPLIIGAHLQSAIDALWISSSTDRSSLHLH